MGTSCFFYQVQSVFKRKTAQKKDFIAKKFCMIKKYNNLNNNKIDVNIFEEKLNIKIY